MELLNLYKIPTEESRVVLMPPSKCSSCKKEALEILDTISNVYIFASNPTVFESQNKNQWVIYYDEKNVTKRGLTKLYPEIFIVKNKKIIEYKPLLN
jgi:hypothetical protein